MCTGWCRLDQTGSRACVVYSDPHWYRTILCTSCHSPRSRYPCRNYSHVWWCTTLKRTQSLLFLAVLHWRVCFALCLFYPSPFCSKLNPSRKKCLMHFSLPFKTCPDCLQNEIPVHKCSWIIRMQLCCFSYLDSAHLYYVYFEHFRTINSFSLLQTDQITQRITWIRM